MADDIKSVLAELNKLKDALGDPTKGISEDRIKLYHDRFGRIHEWLYSLDDRIDDNSQRIGRLEARMAVVERMLN